MWLGEGLDLFDGGVRSDFPEDEAIRRDVNEGEFGDDVVHDLDAGERESAFLEDFGLVVARGVFHSDEDALCAGDEIHCAAHALEHFAGDGPVGESSRFVHLERTQDGQVDMGATDHGERIGGGEITCAGEFGDGFLSSVDEVGVDFGFDGIRTDAEHAVFGLQDDFDTGWNEVGDKRRHTDAKIDVIAVAEFAGDAAGNAFAFLVFC